VTVSGSAAALTAALQPLADTLAADGYRLHASHHGEAVRVGIEAGPEACADCLVPKPMMGAMIADTLARSGISVTRVDLSYPGDA
jgi:hypothetical protein